MEPPPSTKPINVFYVWYTELCRRLNCTPAPCVKPAKPKSTTVLDFVADGLRVADWQPIATALRTDTSLHVIRVRSRRPGCVEFLRDVDTEEKARRMKRPGGSLRTDYVLRLLVRAISGCARHSDVLTCLELDGLPMFDEYLEPLLQALRKNRTVRRLSFANCSIGDSGCELVCAYARQAPNVEVLNLAGCALSSRSGEHIGKLVKHQQIDRYCESWHNSLRYENPRSEAMRGLKRITLNSNPELGDDGLAAILDELEDDLWVKALDAQRCGITDSLASRILHVVQCNKSLEILDLRQNERLDIAVLDKILQVLRERQYQTQPEYQWCSTALSLTWNSARDSGSRSSFGTVVHKTKSAPVRSVSVSSSTSSSTPMRKTKTSTTLRDPVDAKIHELSSRLRLETTKRREVEERNEQLRREMEKIKNQQRQRKDHQQKNHQQQQQKNDRLHHHVARQAPQAHQKVQKTDKKERNGYRNGHTRNGDGLVSNGFPRDARRIFEDLLRGASRGAAQADDDEADDELLDYFLRAEGDSSSTATLTRTRSDESLRGLVDELRGTPTRSNRR